MKPEVKELTYSRKSTNINREKKENNVVHESITSDQTNKLNIALIKNITKGKRIDSYGEAPWFDDALR